MATQDDYIRTALRVPRDLHKALHESASKSSRTFNAEIIARLAQSFTQDRTDMMDRIEEHLKRLDEAQERIEKREAGALAMIKAQEAAAASRPKKGS